MALIKENDMNNPLLTEAIGVYFLDMVPPWRRSPSEEDGSFSIFINARISQARQMIAYQHALAHIMRDDFSKTDADEIEKAM